MKVATLSLVASCLFGINTSLVIERRTFGPLLQMLLGVNNNNNNNSNNQNNIVVDATGGQPGQPGYAPPAGAQAQAQATAPAAAVAPATATGQPIEIYNDIASNPQQSVNAGAYNSAAAAAQQQQQQQMYGQAGMGYPYPQPYPYPPPPPRGPPPGYCYIGNPDPYCRSCHSESEDPACNPPEAYDEYEEDDEYGPPSGGRYPPPPSPYGGGYPGYGRY